MLVVCIRRCGTESGVTCISSRFTSSRSFLSSCSLTAFNCCICCSCCAASVDAFGDLSVVVVVVVVAAVAAAVVDDDDDDGVCFRGVFTTLVCVFVNVVVSKRRQHARNIVSICVKGGARGC